MATILEKKMMYQGIMAGRLRGGHEIEEYGSIIASNLVSAHKLDFYSLFSKERIASELVTNSASTKKLCSKTKDRMESLEKLIPFQIRTKLID